MIPAWLMPIQKTKLVMKKPHMMGRFNPVTPTPLFNMKPKAPAPARKTSRRKATSPSHHLGVPRTPDRRSWLISFGVI